MGFFNNKTVCSICSNDTGLNRLKIANKEWLCKECLKKCKLNTVKPIHYMTSSEIKELIKEAEINQKEWKSFIITREVPKFLKIDDKNKKWVIPVSELSKIYNFADIIDFELLEDGDSVVKGGLGRAIAGGVLFGGVGAIVGGVTGNKKSKAVCNSLKIKITVKSMFNPTEYINFITTPTKKDSILYTTYFSSAQECLSNLQLICNEINNDKDSTKVESNISVADEILKFKNLLDNGIISEEEFKAKKEELLNL